MVVKPSVQFQNSSGTALANVYVYTNGTTFVSLKNNGNFNVQGLALNLSGTTGVTLASNTCSSTLTAGATCSFNLVGGNTASSTTGAAVTATGTNITTTALPVTAGNTVAWTTIDPSTQLAAVRGISLLQLQLQNNTATAMTGVSLSTTSSYAQIVSNDSSRPNTCGTSLGAGATCTFWIRASNEPTLGNDTSQTLSLQYTQSAPHNDTIPSVVTTSLYAAGQFAITSSCYTTLNSNGTLSGSGNCSNLARFDGTNWFEVANGDYATSSTVIRDMILANDKLYLAGNYADLDLTGSTTPAYYASGWDGTAGNSLGTSSSTPTAPSANVFNKWSNQYSVVNMLAYDSANNSLFYNRIEATSGGTTQSDLIYAVNLNIYAVNLNNLSWAVKGSALSNSSDPSTISSTMAYSIATNTLYLTGSKNYINSTSGTTQPALIWSWNGTSWSPFTPS